MGGGEGIGPGGAGLTQQLDEEGKAARAPSEVMTIELLRSLAGWVAVRMVPMQEERGLARSIRRGPPPPLPPAADRSPQDKFRRNPQVLPAPSGGSAGSAPGDPQPSAAFRASP